eukprot:1159574-Pelagomonas_calceolata.AAC.4
MLLAGAQLVCVCACTTLLPCPAGCPGGTLHQALADVAFWHLTCVRVRVHVHAQPSRPCPNLETNPAGCPGGTLHQALADVAYWHSTCARVRVHVHAQPSCHALQAAQAALSTKRLLMLLAGA